MKREILSHLEKARKNLDAAEMLLGNGFPAIAASRVYYGIFYAACAMLQRGREFLDMARSFLALKPECGG